MELSIDMEKCGKIISQIGFELEINNSEYLRKTKTITNAFKIKMDRMCR